MPPEPDELFSTRIEVRTPELETHGWVVDDTSRIGRSSFPRSEDPQNPQRIIAAAISSILLAARVPVAAKKKAVFVFSSDSSAAISTITQILQLLPNMLRGQPHNQLQDQVAKLVEAMLPQNPTENLAQEIADENLVLRQRFMHEWPSLTSKQVHERAGNKGKNTALTASRWKRQGNVFAVRFGNVDHYPAFQFREGQPKAVVGRILKEFGDRRTPWQVALWFVAENGWLDGRRPVDLLDTEPDPVVAAAQQELDEAIF